jgi:hypothetical protein
MLQPDHGVRPRRTGDTSFRAGDAGNGQEINHKVATNSAARPRHSAAPPALPQFLTAVAKFYF